MDTKINLKISNYSPIQKELVRKSIHMSISFLPFIVSYNYNFSISLLFLGIMVYLVSEICRVNGKNLGIITDITVIAARSRDNGVTLGPLTLAVGSLLPLLFFNHAAFTCGIFALAFGDGLSSVTGKLWGNRKIPFTNGKSIVGSFTCFTMILSTSYGVTGDLVKSLLAAIGGTVVELIPIKDIDNLIIPFTVALIVSL